MPRMVPMSSLVIANGQTASGALSISEFSDAEGITLFIPALAQTAQVQVSDEDVAAPVGWFNLITGITKVLIGTTDQPAAVTISPIAFRSLRVVAGVAVGSAMTIKTVKFWRGAGA